MKKLALLLFVSLCGITSMAQTGNTDISTIGNVVYIEPVTVPAGSQQTISIKMKNTVGIQTVQFDMIFPEGIRVALDEDGYELLELSTERTTARKMDSFSAITVSDGHYRVLINSTLGNTFDGNDGEIATMVVNIPSTVEAGEYPIVFKEIVLVDTSSNGFETEQVQTFITVEGQSDGRIHFDENATKLPSYTAGEKGDVRMTRTLKKDVWNTIVLPFTLTKAKAEDEKVFGPDVQLAEFIGFSTEYDENDDDDTTPNAIVVNFATYTLKGTKPMTGGKPFLIKVSKDITEFIADDVTLFDEVTDVNKTDEYETSGKFSGTFIKSVVPADGLFISNNKFYYSTGVTNIKAFRGWFDLDAVLGKETDFGSKIRFTIDDETTSIEGIESTIAEGDVYTVQGIYVGHNVDRSRLPKGVYIVGGKKVLIK